jgi:hypothetical protein
MISEKSNESLYQIIGGKYCNSEINLMLIVNSAELKIQLKLPGFWIKKTSIN